MSPSVVITDSTRGIGYALATAFLKRGCSVTISGHTQQGLEDALARMAGKAPAERIFGHPCDVTDYNQVQQLWEKAKPILNIIAERPETLAPVLVEKILKNKKNGVTIRYSSPARLLVKFFIAPFRKRDLFTPR
jgi:short-subunit dehydrogenase involved in D-alanine esterification of teichoic acids